MKTIGLFWHLTKHSVCVEPKLPVTKQPWRERIQQFSRLLFAGFWVCEWNLLQNRMQSFTVICVNINRFRHNYIIGGKMSVLLFLPHAVDDGELVWYNYVSMCGQFGSTDSPRWCRCPRPWLRRRWSRRSCRWRAEADCWEAAIWKLAAEARQFWFPIYCCPSFLWADQEAVWQKN